MCTTLPVKHSSLMGKPTVFFTWQYRLGPFSSSIKSQVGDLYESIINLEYYIKHKSSIILISQVFWQVNGVMLIDRYPYLHWQLFSDKITPFWQVEHQESVLVHDKQSHLQKIPSINTFQIAHYFAIPFRFTFISKISKSSF